jgi:RNA polymerase sigma-70 factor (ECF subfamily)
VAPEALPDDPASLAGRIARGDRAAEDELVARYRRAVTVILSGSRRDAAAIEDLFQETFRIAIEKIRAGALREPERLSGFLCALARNLAIQHFRKIARHPSAGDPDPEALAAPGAGPLEELLRSERAAITRRVLSELPSDRDRQILYRFYIAEDDKDRICRDLALTSLHFNRVLFRARERYRTLYLEAAARGAG